MPRDDRDWDDVREARKELREYDERDLEWLRVQREVAAADKRERDAEEKR